MIGVECPYPPRFVRRVGWGGRREDGAYFPSLGSWIIGCIEKLKNAKSNYGYSYFIAP